MASALLKDSEVTRSRLTSFLGPRRKLNASSVAMSSSDNANSGDRTCTVERTLEHVQSSRIVCLLNGELGRLMDHEPYKEKALTLLFSHTRWTLVDFGMVTTWCWADQRMST
jgi:hypothetical protein